MRPSALIVVSLLICLVGSCGGGAPDEQRPAGAGGKADSLLHGPNTVFTTIDEAALDARLYCLEQEDLSIEYGGWISQLADGGFTYRELYKGTTGRVQIPYSKFHHLLLGYVAAFHTHPKRSYATSSTEYFSDGDIRFADDLYQNKGLRPGYFYLFTPWGKILRYDPGLVKTTGLRPEQGADATDPSSGS